MFTVYLQESVCKNNIPGFRKVENLADCLIGLRDKLSLTNDQADSVIRLWNDLEEYDKRPTKIPMRHQGEPLKGRFKAKSKVAPGVEATQR